MFWGSTQDIKKFRFFRDMMVLHVALLQPKKRSVMMISERVIELWISWIALALEKDSSHDLNKFMLPLKDGVMDTVIAMLEPLSDIPPMKLLECLAKIKEDLFTVTDNLKLPYGIHIENSAAKENHCVAYR